MLQLTPIPLLSFAVLREMVGLSLTRLKKERKERAGVLLITVITQLSLSSSLFHNHHETKRGKRLVNTFRMESTTSGVAYRGV